MGLKAVWIDLFNDGTFAEIVDGWVDRMIDG